MSSGHSEFPDSHFQRPVEIVRHHSLIQQAAGAALRLTQDKKAKNPKASVTSCKKTPARGLDMSQLLSTLDPSHSLAHSITHSLACLLTLHQPESCPSNACFLQRLLQSCRSSSDCLCKWRTFEGHLWSFRNISLNCSSKSSSSFAGIFKNPTTAAPASQTPSPAALHSPS